MNDIKFNCPQCGQHLAVAAESANATVACPQCGQAIVVPQLARVAKPRTPSRLNWRLLSGGCAVVALLVIGLIIWQMLWRNPTPADPVPSAQARSAASMVAKGRMTPEALFEKRFRFVWKWNNKSGTNGIATLHSDGTISGIASPNETFWLIDEKGQLVFKHQDGRISSIFTQNHLQNGKWFFSGPFQFESGVEHQLEEIGPP